MSKRGENIYKRKDGRWEGRYIKERSADGKARYAYVYGKSYADAKQKLLDRRIAQAQNIDCSPSHTKYGDILRNWIAMSRVHIKESTYSRYVHLANVHILPYLGELPTDKLTTQTVEKHISFLLNKGRVDKKGGLAPKTVSDILTLIKGSIDYANCSGYSVNCYLDRLTVKKTQLDMRVLSIDEQHRLCDILMRDMNLTKFGVLLCMYTGIRIGEVCALKWESIDFSEGILSIRETLQRIQATDVGACKKTKIVITEPKSKKAIRDIPLPGFVLEYAASLKHNPKAYILTGCSDRYIEPRSLQYTFQVYLIVLFGNMMADEHTAQAVEKHEVELIYVKESCSMLKAILSDISDKHLYRQVERAYDLIQASPVKSAASVHSIESQVINEIDNLGLAVRNGDAVAISGIADKIARLANERNRLLRLVN